MGLEKSLQYALVSCLQDKRLLSASLVLFTTTLGIGFIIPLLPFFGKLYGGELFVGLLFSGFAISRAILAPIVSSLSDRFGRKLFITSGLIFFSIFSVMYVYSRSAVELITTRIIHGAASTMVGPVILAYVSDISPEGKEASYFGFLGGSLLLGFGIGPIMGGIFADSFGIRAPFLAMGVLGVIAFLLSALLISEEPRVSRGDVLRSMFSATKLHKEAFLIWFLVTLPRGGLLAFLPLMMDNWGYSPGDVGITFASFTFCSALAQYASGSLIDRMKRRLKGAAVIGLVSSVIFALFPFTKGMLELSILSGIFGGFGSITLPMLTSEVTKTMRRCQGAQAGSAMGFLEFAFSLGMITGAVLLGAISQAVGVEKMMFVASGILCILFLPLVKILR